MFDDTEIWLAKNKLQAAILELQ